MAEDKRPPLPSFSSQASTTSLSESYADPFADRNRHLQFQEPVPRPFDSQVSLVPSEFGERSSVFEDGEEKVPLTSTQGMSGSLYPPGYVPITYCTIVFILLSAMISSPDLLTPTLLGTPTLGGVRYQSPQQPRLVSSLPGDVDKPLNVVLPARLNSQRVTSSQSILSQHPYTLPSKRSGRTPIQPSFRALWPILQRVLVLMMVN